VSPRLPILFAYFAKKDSAAEYTYEGTHRYHGVVLIKVSGTGITHWREYQHISPLAWQEFVGVTKF
jgi:hypothetical protein